MYYEVYLDFYFLESFLTDVALLILVKTVMREKWKAKRIAGTAVLESMWSCIELLLPFRGSFTATFFWIVSVLLLVMGGLGKRTAKEVLYGALLLGISSFCFGGALYVAETFRYIPGIFVKMAVFLILWMFLYLYTETDQNRQRICEVSLWQCGKNRKVKALYDTGNRLREPYKKRPVNIIEYEAAKELLDGKENVFLIPYRTVSGSGEMLRGIVFDRMIVSKGRKTEIYEHPVIALTGERVSSDGSYQMILHPDNRKNQEEKDYV